MKITIIGAGNTGKAWAVLLQREGEEVVLYTRNEATCQSINQSGIELSGLMEGVERVHCTTDLAEAIEEANLILISTTADGHKPIAEQLKPLLKPNQNVLVLNGNWGAYEFLEVFGEALFSMPNQFAETNSMMIIVSPIDERRANLKRLKQTVGVAYLHRGGEDYIREFLEKRFENVEYLDNVIESSLNNSNPVIHGPISLLNLGRMEIGLPFRFYPEGASRTAVNYIVAIDQERVLIGQTIGIQSQAVLDMINSFWPDKHDNLYDALLKNTSYQTALGPKTLDHRYITEDFPYGLEPLRALAAAWGLETPALNAMLDFARIAGVSAPRVNISRPIVEAILKR